MMNRTESSPRRRTGAIPAILCLAIGVGAGAADGDLRIVGQLAAGTAGVEPGLALEWRGPHMNRLIARPELLLSEDGRLGVGAALLYDLSSSMELPPRQAFAIGPRLVYHNADSSGWEADAMATWGFDLGGGTDAWRHAIGVLGAVGICRDRKHDDSDLGLTIGIFYSYRL